jgi:large subunit ribosomal protein L24
MFLKKDDLVRVLTGDEAGTNGRILDIDRENGKVVVEGVNRVYKHVRRSQKNPQGGRLSKEMPVKISNVQLVCPACGSPSRLGARFDKEGAKYRFCKKCKKDIDQISPPRKGHATA